jgi:thiol:disulfide interchange protein
MAKGPSGQGRTTGWVSRLRDMAVRRERWLWFGVFALVAAIQWPMLKGFYYRATGVAGPASRIEWRTDVAAALAEARRTGRPVLVDFGAEWCPPCLAMKHDVWPDREVGRAVSVGYVPLAVDVDRNGPVAEHYGVNGIPVVLILDAEGHEVRRASGYLPVSGILRFLSETRQTVR